MGGERLMLVYLAGPIAQTTDVEANEWRQLAWRTLGQHGIGVLDPMRRDFRGKEIDNVAAIVEDDKRDIDQADVVLANCWQVSVGTSMEILYAWQKGKRVVIHVPADKPVSPWLTYHSHLVSRSMMKALEWILGPNDPLRDFGDNLGIHPR